MVAWRSSLFEVRSITMELIPHVRVIGGHRGWELTLRDAVIHAAGPLAEDPAYFDDYERLLTAWLLTDAHVVMAASAQLGQRGERWGQEWWLRAIRDDTLELLDLHRVEIDRVAAALADRRVLDADDLVELLGQQVLQDAADSATGREEPA